MKSARTVLHIGRQGGWAPRTADLPRGMSFQGGAAVNLLEMVSWPFMQWALIAIASTVTVQIGKNEGITQAYTTIV